MLSLGISRTLLIKFGIIELTALTFLIMAIAIISRLVLYWLVGRTGLGKFLFERPDWAHPPAPGTATSSCRSARPSSFTIATDEIGPGYDISTLAFSAETHQKSLATPNIARNSR
ncbi:MAG: hypothetical protein MO846_02830 [Candidatus Devosia symbiotica]|nr:hypothetical protein [Candidatus Devosia symbiotica]